MLERPKSSENTHDGRALDDRWPLIVRWTFDSQRTPTVRRTGIHKRPLEVGRVLKLLLPLVTSLVCSFPWQLRARAAMTGDLTSLSRSSSLQVCARGRQHIYKFLEMKAVRGEQEERLRRGASDELELRSARPPPVGGNDVMSPQPRPAAPPPPAAAAAAGPESRGSVVGQRGSHAPPPHDPAGYSGGLDWTETHRVEEAGGGGGVLVW